MQSPSTSHQVVLPLLLLLLLRSSSEVSTFASGPRPWGPPVTGTTTTTPTPTPTITPTPTSTTVTAITTSTTIAACHTFAHSADCMQIDGCTWDFHYNITVGLCRSVNDPPYIITVGPIGVIGVPCVFPFVYGGTEYDACTAVGMTYGVWCATQVVPGTHVLVDDTSWGVCPRPPATTTVLPVTATSSTDLPSSFWDDFVYTGECAGGGLALTPALYAQGYAAYKDAVCIPKFAFCNDYCPPGSPAYQKDVGDVTLENMEQLLYVGQMAFYYFPGKLTMTGSFPEYIGNSPLAFSGASNPNSEISIHCRGSIWENIDNDAFDDFVGIYDKRGEACYCSDPCGTTLAPTTTTTVTTTPKKSTPPSPSPPTITTTTTTTTTAAAATTTTGTTTSSTGTQNSSRPWIYTDTCIGGGLALTPVLYAQGHAAYKDAVCIPDYAFCYDDCPANSPAFQQHLGDLALESMDQLRYVGQRAFSLFPGKLTIVGSFKSWTSIKWRAFYGIKAPDSKIKIQCRGSSWSVLGGNAPFLYFSGIDEDAGVKCACSDLSCAQTSTTPAGPPQSPTTSSSRRLQTYPPPPPVPPQVCKDGGLALTPALYMQGYEAYKNAVCIPDGAFCEDTGFCSLVTFPKNMTRDVTLENMEQLTYVGLFAFFSFAGTLTIKGSFPNWQHIGDSAFAYAGNYKSVVSIGGGALVTVGDESFKTFQGTLILRGHFPAWKVIGTEAFSSASNPNNQIVIQCRSELWSLGARAFENTLGLHDDTGESCVCTDPCAAANNATTITTTTNAAGLACKDGGLPLTPALYMQGYEAYKDAVCVPDAAFCQDSFFCPNGPGLSFTGDVILENMEQLTYVGLFSFYTFQGNLTIRGSFPKWQHIGEDAFSYAGIYASSIRLDAAAAPALQTVGDEAFVSFQGTLSMTGYFPNWTSIGTDAFSSTGRDSAIILNGGALEKVGDFAFFDFKGTLEITGAFPKWTFVGENAFSSAGNLNNVIEIQCRGDTWLVSDKAFLWFEGVHASSGEGCACSALSSCTSTTSVTISTTSAPPGPAPPVPTYPPIGRTTTVTETSTSQPAASTTHSRHQPPPSEAPSGSGLPDWAYGAIGGAIFLLVGLTMCCAYRCGRMQTIKRLRSTYGLGGDESDTGSDGNESDVQLLDYEYTRRYSYPSQRDYDGSLIHSSNMSNINSSSGSGVEISPAHHSPSRGVLSAENSSLLGSPNSVGSTGSTNFEHFYAAPPQ